MYTFPCSELFVMCQFVFYSVGCLVLCGGLYVTSATWFYENMLCAEHVLYVNSATWLYENILCAEQFQQYSGFTSTCSMLCAVQKTAQSV